MVRVVNNAQPKRHICKNCWNELEYEYDDVFREREKDYILSLTLVTSYIRCPACKEKVRLGQYAEEWD